MAGNARYAQYCALVDATLVQGVIDAGVDPGNQVAVHTPEGGVDPTASSKVGAAPLMRFTALEVGTLLDAVGIGGLDVTTALEIGYQERTAGGALEAATGEKVAAAKCLIIPEMIVAAQQGDAAISYLGYCYSADGTTHPLAYTNALPAGTPAVSQRATMGTVTIGGAPIGKVLSFSVSFGIGVRVYAADGDVYPTALSIVARNPVATIEVADMGELSDADLAGAEVSALAFNLLLRSLTGGALAGAGDRSLTMAKAFLDITQTRGAKDGDAGLTMTARARKDGATAIIVVG